MPIDYDPLLSKVIAAGETREAARARLIAALRAYPVLGMRTNIPFLLRVLEHPAFRAGTIDTGFLDERARHSQPTPSRRPSMCRLPFAQRRLRMRRGTWRSHVRRRGVDPLGSLASTSRMARLMADAHASRIGDGVYRVEQDGHVEIVYIAGPPDDLWAYSNGRVFRGLLDRQPREHRPATPTDVRQSLAAPMPATVLRVLVQPGASVRKGETMVILEAMKMELPLRAPADAVVTAVHCREGELVQAEAPLVDFR